MSINMRIGLWLCVAMNGLAHAALAQLAVNQPAVNQPAVNQPAVNQPAVNQPAVNQPGGPARAPAGTPGEVPGGGREWEWVQEQVVSAIAQAEKSVVAIVRVRKDPAADGFQIPNLGRLGVGLRADESAPTDRDFLPSAFGAGVVIDRAGLIVTTYHVLGNIRESDYFVWTQDRPFRAQVLAADGWFDLAVLKVEAGDLQPIKLGDGKVVAKGQFVLALGNPHAAARDGRASASWGLVSNLQRRAPRVAERANDAAGRETVHQYGTLIQTDAKWDVGFSGGPLVNLAGEMIGLTTAYAGDASRASTAGFAIPVDDYFRTALDRLKTGQSPEFGFLGVGPQPLDLRLRQMGHTGALVESVLPSTPAGQAGIVPGDIITHADGQPLYDDDDLIRIIGSLPPQRVVQLALWRGDRAAGRGEVLRKEVVLTKKYIHSRRPAYATVQPPVWRGLRIDYGSLAQRGGLVIPPLPPAGCLLVVQVEPESAAWKAGLRADQFVVAVGERAVTNPAEFWAAVEGETGEVRLRVLGEDGREKVLGIAP